MPDPRFFTNNGALSLQYLTDLTGAELFCDPESSTSMERILLSDVAPLDKASRNEISFLDNSKYIPMLKSSSAGVCFMQEKYRHHAPRGMVLLLTPEPYRAFAMAAAAFYPVSSAEPMISPSASVDATAVLGRQASISAGAVIGRNAEIGDHCIIEAGTLIGDGVVIGANSTINGNSTLTHCIVGERVIIHRGVHIGQDGFGFALGKNGHYKVPQLGRVLIEDDVEIGSGTCIDRGSAQDTIIGSGTKIDNLVQIGHNVVIGRDCIIVAQAAIAGSTHIGHGVIIAGQSGIAGHLKIGNGVKIAARSGVMQDIPDGMAYGGSPAVPVKQWHRQTVAIARLAERKEIRHE